MRLVAPFAQQAFDYEDRLGDEQSLPIIPGGVFVAGLLGTEHQVREDRATDRRLDGGRTDPGHEQPKRIASTRVFGFVAEDELCLIGT